MSITTTHRNLIIGGAALVAAVAMAASADTLAALGRAVGWGYVLSWALPVSVDVLALVAGLAWIAAGTGRSLGRVLTLLTVAVSVLLNALGHLVSTGHLTASPYLVIGVSAVPPLAAALAVHLGATVTTDRTAPSTDHDRVDHGDERANQTGPKNAGQDAGTRCRTASTRRPQTTTRGPRTNQPTPPLRTATPQPRTNGPTPHPSTRTRSRTTS